MRVSACVRVIKTQPMVIIIGLSLIFFVVVLGRCSMSNNNRVVVFDARALKGDFIRQLALHHANSEQVKRAYLAFNKGLDEVLKGYAASHRAIILDKKSVISGGDDITPVIKDGLSHRMRRPS